VILRHPGRHRPHDLMELIDVGRQGGGIDVQAADDVALRGDSPFPTAS
jgi:hypothetical protein